MKSIWKHVSACVLLLAMVLVLAACSSKDGGNTGDAATQQGAGTLPAVAAARYVDEAKMQAFSDLVDGLIEGKVTFQAVSTGDPEGDPMGTMAGMAKLGGLFASGEVELFVCDTENAQRYGASDPQMYAALSSLFTQEELNSFKAPPVTIALTDEQGAKTGEETAPCGINLSGNAAVTGALGWTDVNVFIIGSAKNMDLAKQVLLALAVME